MQPYPHHYLAGASASATSDVRVASPELPDLVTAAPKEFGGPGGLWSPETLLCAAVADCFVLSFRAIARAAKLEWSALDCQVEGRLERDGGVSRFTSIKTRALLTLGAGPEEEAVRRLLEKAERSCLIANSLNASRSIEISLQRSS
jgi:organic hydroperoxide reductase OsmC/OhrA